MRTDEVLGLHTRIRQALSSGRTASQIAREVGCSRQTVCKVMAGPVDDKRAGNPGRPDTLAIKGIAAALQVREERPTCGPVMISAILARRPERYGLHPDEVPSSTSVGRLLKAKGLSRKPVGPRDKRLYPVSREDEPGCISLDLWGPWSIRADNVYLATVQDRFTRLAGAIPAAALSTPQNAADLPGLTAST